ncbi:MAG: hypothetical protein SPE03_05990 [Treponema sp.]|nr:hypothetical protein [Treponema sp.]
MSIENIIEDSLKELKNRITQPSTNTDKNITSRLIFPQYRDKSARYSEQELKQIFLHKIENNMNYFYSLETPTKHVYRFTKSENPKVKIPDDNNTDDKYESARFDVSLYSENNIDSLASCIEFKHNNPDEKKGICKDFLKLAKEVKFTKEKKNFFVHYHYLKSENSWPSNSFKSIFGKYRNSVEYIAENHLEDKTDLENVTVYLVCIHGKSASTYHFSLADLKNNYTVGTKYSDLTEKDWLNEKIFNTEN